VQGLDYEIVQGEISLIDSLRSLRQQKRKPKVRVEFQQNGHLEQQDFSLSDIGKNQ